MCIGSVDSAGSAGWVVCGLAAGLATGLGVAAGFGAGGLCPSCCAKTNRDCATITSIANNIEYRCMKCRGGPPWPPVAGLLRRKGGHGGPPLHMISSSFLLCLGFVLDLAAISLAVMILRVVLHLARILTTSRVILAVFLFHFARTAVAAASFHCTARLALLLVALSGSLCDGCCKRSQQQR